jgi:hypothetical protein
MVRTASTRDRHGMPPAPEAPPGVDASARQLVLRIAIVVCFFFVVGVVSGPSDRVPRASFADFLDAVERGDIKHDFGVTGKGSAWIERALPIVILVVLLGGVWLVLRRRSAGGAGPLEAFRRAPAREVASDAPRTRFADVAGADEAVKELCEITTFLRSPSRFDAIGARIPKGVLLFGPPGTGKTLLARAVAGEADVPFFSIAGSDFVEMFVGVGAGRVRDLFKQVRHRRAPSAPRQPDSQDLDPPARPDARPHDRAADQGQGADVKDGAGRPDDGRPRRPRRGAGRLRRDHRERRRRPPRGDRHGEGHGDALRHGTPARAACVRTQRGATVRGPLALPPL